MLAFDSENHIYTDGGVILPSVTQITRYLSVDSRTTAGTDPFYRERGTAIHDYCTDYDLTRDLPTGTGFDGYLKGYADFKRDYRIKDWIYVEHMMGGASYGFAGTADRIGYIDGKLSILDIKTSSTVNKLSLAAQLTGYAILFGGETNLYGLQLMSKGDYRLIKVNREETIFNACNYLNERMGKKKDGK